MAKTNPANPKPADEKPAAQLPRLSLRGWLLFLWRQLTSMQTCLLYTSDAADDIALV